MLQFVKTSDQEKAAEVLAARLRQELEKRQRVLWLISGGSNLPITVQAMQQLPPETHKNLAIMFTDERFGPVNHKDSNMSQLGEFGFEQGKATMVPVLIPGDFTLEQTTARYERALQTAFDNADVIIGQFGIGGDGHIAGILPHSLAVDSGKLVCGYDGSIFQRITMTPEAILRLDAAYTFAFGDTKKEALENLQQKGLPLSEQPAQILKQVPEAYVYNDQIGDQL